MLKTYKDIVPQSRGSLQTFVCGGQVRAPHKTSLCKMSRLFEAISSLSLDVPLLNLVSYVILDFFSSSVHGCSFTALFQKLRKKTVEESIIAEVAKRKTK